MPKEGPVQDAGRLAADTADAMLKAGAAVARTFAEAVSGRPPPIVPGEPPLASLVRHASAGAAGIARIMIDAARDATQVPPQAGTPADVPPPPPIVPSIAPGATLRIPLSIDNPGATPMTDLVPAVVGATLDGRETLPPKVRFQPRKLTIAPRDFEKLTILIDIPPDAEQGLVQLAFTLDGTAESASNIAFRVE